MVKIYSKNSSFCGKIKEMASLDMVLAILRILFPISLCMNATKSRKK